MKNKKQTANKLFLGTKSKIIVFLPGTNHIQISNNINLKYK